MYLANTAALAALGLIPILLIIHSLKPRPRTEQVSSLYLWREVLKEKKGGLKLQRFISNLPLLLQILAVILGSLALAQPVWTYESRIKGDVILVMDSTASMKTKTGDGSRFDKAKAEALNLVDELPDGSQMMIIEAGAKPLLTARFSPDKTLLKNTIRNMTPTDAPGEPDKSIYLALSFMDHERQDQVFFITDGAAKNTDELLALNDKIKPIFISGGENNVGITRFEFRPQIHYAGSFQVLLEIKNFNRYALVCPVEVTYDGELAIQQNVALAAGEKKLLIFPHLGEPVEEAIAEIKLDDDLEVDNKAYTVMDPSKKIWVLLVSPGNYFLETVLKAFPNVLVNKIKTVNAAFWDEQVQRHDIVILDRVSAPSTKTGRFFFIDAYSPDLPIKKVGSTGNPAILDWARVNPITANLDLSGLQIESASVVTTAPEVTVIAESEETGLLFSYEADGLKAVFLGFDFMKSDLPLKVAFPVLMGNIFDWLFPAKLRFKPLKTIAGKSMAISLDPATKKISIRSPSGKWEYINVTAKPYIYEKTSSTGIYAVNEGERRKYFAVNLLDEAESDIAPDGDDEEAAVSGFSQAAATTEALKPLWYAFLLTLALVLTLEWVVWIRRN